VKLSAKRAALLVVDIQDKLIPAMRAEDTARVVKNTQILIQAARVLGLPIVVSQQYPKGLGATIAPIETALEGAAAHRFDKLEFSSAPGLPKLDRDQWIVCGMETHVCVYQTVRDLVARGWATHVVSDAVCSRTEANYQIGLGLAAKADAIVTSTEVVVFDLLERAGSEQFKTLSKAIR
jgi:nicotinamidase-related amidase